MDATKLFADTATLRTADGSEVSIEQIQEWLDRQPGCSMARGQYDRLCDPTWATDCERVALIPLRSNGYQVGSKPWTIYVEPAHQPA